MSAETQPSSETDVTAVNPSRSSQPDARASDETQPAEVVDAKPPKELFDESSDVPTIYFGRYSSSRLVGTGGFGSVYKGYDPELRRPVAIKVARPDRIRPGLMERFLQEARRMARLQHDGILQVFDVGVIDGRCYIVTQFIEGSTLHAWLETNRPTWEQAVQLVAGLAEALAYAHAQRVVHRDVKPRNILLTAELKPILADFGLALADEDAQDIPFGRMAGTLGYMSPEQARGEGHRIDGRTDIYSLGVVFYQLLCSRLPFTAATRSEILRQLRDDEPQPPRQLNRRIPVAVERICLKALAKRIGDRYTTAADMAEDLRAVLGAHKPDAQDGTLEPLSPVPAVRYPVSSGGFSESQALLRIVPKGLRSFGPDDSDFFLELLPGPRDRLGMPDSLRFWKSRIESTDPEVAFTVGLIYGPSGCGKSSLVRAGLLPRLNGSVRAVCIESSRQDTDARLSRVLRHAVPELDGQVSLPEQIAQLRRLAAERSGKVLVVIDQFEQWLHEHGRDLDRSELAGAMRQADGKSVQFLVLVRDDFWLGVTRLFESLEVKLDRDRNVQCVDLFDVKHAQRVLAAFGHAFDRLPERRDEFTADQRRFLDQAVHELSQDGRVIPVRLSLFAELMKSRQWTPASLAEVGGTQGVAVRFLEESFTSPSAVPENRALEKLARSVLLQLLPEAGSEIKGQMRSRAELAAACGLAPDSSRFGRLLEILDRDLHIVTPTESADLEAPAPDGQEGGQSYYQLTHDYLVPPLRQWLVLERQKTWRGRAEHFLDERATQMSRWPQSRYLPSWWQFVRIWLAVPRSRQRAEHRALMYAARRHYTLRGLLLLTLVGLAAAAALTVRHEYVREQRARHGSELVERLLVAESNAVSQVIGEIRQQMNWARPALRQALERGNLTPKQKLHATLAMWREDPALESFLRERLLVAGPAELELLREELQPVTPEFKEFLFTVLSDAESRQDHRLRVACVLAAIDPQHRSWSDVAGDVAFELVAQDALSAQQWVQLLRPVRAWLLPPLRDVFQQTTHRNDALVAAVALAEYADEHVGTLGDLLDRAEAGQISVLARKIGDLGNPGIATLAARIAAPTTGSDLVGHEEMARRQARAAAALLYLSTDHQAAWDCLRFAPNPLVRSYLIQTAPGAGVPLHRLVARLATESDPSVRRAIIQAIGGYREESLSPTHREELAQELVRRYREDPDPGVHSSIEWLMRRWGQQAKLDESDSLLASDTLPDGMGWFRSRQGHMMVVVGPAKFVMGSPRDEVGRVPGDLEPIPMEIHYRFAISSKEVTLEQYRRFKPDYDATGDSNFPDRPVDNVYLDQAAAYCNWLSEQEGMPQSEWCYDAKALNEEGVAYLAADFATRRGYRLPLLQEAECAARAGTTTSRFFGSAADLLPFYARFQDNSDGKSAPVGQYLPNDFGLFDVLGNVSEWTHGRDHQVPKRGYVRGGACYAGADYLRSAFARAQVYSREMTEEERREDRREPQRYRGFRVVRSLP